MDANDLLGKPLMLTPKEREWIDNVADAMLTPVPSTVTARTIILAEETSFPFGMVLKAGLEALK